MKVREILSDGTAALRKAGVDNPDYDARQLLMKAYGLNDTAELLRTLDREVCPGASGGTEPGGITQCPGDCSAMADFSSDIIKRSKRVPLQHILGHTGFMGLDFRVNDSVLIPRPDTETLVETVLSREKDTCISVLDMCTGSGCIAVSLKHHGKYFHVAASDISAAALDVAKGNAKANRTEIDFYCGDLFDFADPGAFYDVIVSNPPYIRTGDIQGLEPEVRDHDPYLALSGGTDGLDFYRNIISGATGYLKPGGRIYFETGSDQAADVTRLMSDAGFGAVETVKDLDGNDRVVFGRL